MPDPLQDQIPSPLELRAQLEAMVRRDLLGPAGGPEEEVDERAVRGICCRRDTACPASLAIAASSMCRSGMAGGGQPPASL